MNATATLTVADRIALTLDGLAKAVAARIVSGLLTAVLIRMIWRRVRRIERRIQVLLARFQAGRLWVRTAAQGRRGGGGRVAAAPGLPRRFGWLMPLVPYEAACFAGQMRSVLQDPEMVALLAASNQARRVLAPLCRMLGIEPEVIGLPQRAVPPAAPVTVKRVRRPRPKVEWGRIPLPRGVLAWAKREGFGKVPRG